MFLASFNAGWATPTGSGHCVNKNISILENIIDICVVIPAYNAEKFIGDALDSVALQTRRPDEVVVVDDGSTDRTQEAVKMWQESNDLKVRMVSQGHAGLPAARNSGIFATQQSWIALLDADDVWCPTHLALLESAAESFPGSVLVFGDIYIFSETAVICEWFSRKKAAMRGVSMQEGKCYLSGSGLYESLVMGNYIVPSGLMFSRQAAALIGFFDENLKVMEDSDFLLRLSRLGGFAYVANMTAGCRSHEGNITHEKNLLQNNYFAFQVLRKILNDSCRLALNESEKKVTREGQSVMAENLIYSASISGLVAYMKALFILFEAGFYGKALNPKNFIRALFYTLNRVSRND